VRELLVIGIGAGDPDQITIEAVKALNLVDVFFLVDKGAVTDELAAVRREICARHIAGSSHRFVDIADPPRDRGAGEYAAAVAQWHEARAALYEQLILDELGPDGSGGFLVWGDPSLYDSTLRVLDRVLARGAVTFTVRVIPGVTSIQTLTARHRVPLNRIGGAVQLTTGRRLAAGLPDDVDDVVVMLDAECAFQQIREDDVEIYWGAYLGMPDEILISGLVSEVGPEIVSRRAEARQKKGWMMDTYLLRRRVERSSGSDR
jgi:precorrin-6A synthase